MKYIILLFLFICCLGCGNKDKEKALADYEKVMQQEESLLSDSDYGIRIGDTVLLCRDEKWDVKKQCFIPANTTKIFNNNRNLTEENEVCELPNDTKAVVIQRYRCDLSNGGVWETFKVQIIGKKKQIGWTFTENIKRHQ